MSCKSCGAEISTERQEKHGNICGECQHKKLKKGRKINIILFYIIVICCIIFTLTVFLNEIWLWGVVISICGIAGILSLHQIIKDTSNEDE
ncbi:MAG: hypothetical protein ACFFCS_24635 [Candidatus Hodarchaeota archaeon]